MAVKKKSKPGRRATGTAVRTRDGQWQPLVTLLDGSRKRVKERYPTKGAARKAALAHAKMVQERRVRRREPSDVAPPTQQASPATCMKTWVERWTAMRERRGMTYAYESQRHYQNHIGPFFGHKHVQTWTEDDLLAFVLELDRQITAAELKPKTAANIWGTATRICADACRSKDPSLRCRRDNPSKSVEGPESGEEATKSFLYPAEAVRFFECEDVPFNWRRMTALAIWLFPRTGELRALEWSDVDLEHGTVHIHRSEERRTKEVKPVKTKLARRIPIEPTLLPLLDAMRKESGGVGRLIHIPSDAARPFRRFLLRAGIDRPDLHEASRTNNPIRFYDCRASGITWQAVRGDDALKIMERAGHKSIATTMAYIRTAQQLERGFGEPFPELPEVLLEDPRGKKRTRPRALPTARPENNGAIWRKRTGIEPARDSGTAPHQF